MVLPPQRPRRPKENDDNPTCALTSFDEILDCVQASLKTAQGSLRLLANMKRQAAVNICDPSNSSTVLMCAYCQNGVGDAKLMQSEGSLAMTGRPLLHAPQSSRRLATQYLPNHTGILSVTKQDVAKFQDQPLLLDCNTADCSGTGLEVLKLSQPIAPAPGNEANSEESELDCVGMLREEWRFRPDAPMLWSVDDMFLDTADDGKDRWNPCVLYPDSPGRVSWDVLALMIVGADMILLPLLAFHDFTKDNTMRLLDDFGCIFWTLDMLLSFRTGYLKGSLVIVNGREIAMNYLRGWFIADVLVVLFEWLSFVSKTEFLLGVFGVSRYVSRYRLFLKLVRLVRTLNVTSRCSQHLLPFWGHAVISISKMGVAGVFLIHISTCIWYVVGSKSLDGWANAAEVDSQLLYTKYLMSARWILGQLTGRTDDVPGRTTLELAFICIYAVFAVLFKTCFIGIFTTKMIELQSEYESRTKSAGCLRRHCQRYHLSNRVRVFGLQHIQRSQTLQSVRSDHELLMGILPSVLASDFLEEMCAPTLSKHALFERLRFTVPKGARLICTHAAKITWGAPKEIVFEKNVPGTRMLCAKDGELRYSTCRRFKALMSIWAGDSSSLSSKEFSHTEDGLLGVTVEIGMCVSEMALWVNWETRGELICLSLVTFVSVDVTDFIRTVTGFTELRNLCATYAKHVVQKMEPFIELNDLHPSALHRNDWWEETHSVSIVESYCSSNLSVDVLPVQDNGTFDGSRC
eukprot:TRINITY_DN6767_c0_g2_i4.p1 TRINITY_DN6767_c0_g2~~TRINITY_DN6767_c0_g2_i4.p1  ORF type:complete len:774 (-),score=63.45 TRINITY_DN6767_c0_g2_i4:203-2437(-)